MGMTGYNETKGIGDPRLASLFNGFVASKSARTRLKTADKSKWPQQLGFKKFNLPLEFVGLHDECRQRLKRKYVAPRKPLCLKYKKKPETMPREFLRLEFLEDGNDEIERIHDIIVGLDPDGPDRYTIADNRKKKRIKRQLQKSNATDPMVVFAKNERPDLLKDSGTSLMERRKNIKDAWTGLTDEDKTDFKNQAKVNETKRGFPAHPPRYMVTPHGYLPAGAEPTGKQVLKIIE